MADANIYPVEIEAPDITLFKAGNTGIDYITTFDSGVAGPHVMISAIVHGNEICGPFALDFLFKNDVRPACGKLTLGFFNIAAFEAFDPKDPNASRWVDEDFNRVWGKDVLDGERDTIETRRAREVRPIVEQVDFLLDLHSMQNATAPLMLAGPTMKGRQLARDIGYPAHVMCDQGHAAGRRMRDYGDFWEEASPKNALLVECGQHWEMKSAWVARETALRFLLNYNMIDRDFAARYLTDPLPEQKIIEVTGPITIETEEFRFVQPFLGLEVIEKAGTIIGWDGDKEIRTTYDNCVLIMPSRRLSPGLTAVRLGRFF